MENKIERANKLTVATENGQYAGHFFRTHKELLVVRQAETGFKADPNANATLNREMFRQYLMTNAATYGINWDPQDRRTEDNLVPRRYDNEALVAETACRMIKVDIDQWIAKANEQLPNNKLELVSITDDEFTAVTEYNGKQVSHRYANGCWAYAKQSVTAIIEFGTIETYLSMDLLLVSGQLKKPSKVNDSGYHYTGFVTELGKDVAAIKAIVPGAKKEDKAPMVKVMTAKEFMADVEQVAASK